LELAVAFVLSEPTLKAAAQKAGISERTLKSWSKLPEFVALLREARRRTFEQAISRLASVTSKAVTALEEGLEAGDRGQRLKAASTILANVGRLLEVGDLAVELEAIRDLLENPRGG
jgi:hypothetical protein